MENISKIFITALEKKLQDAPRGTKARIAEHLGISAGRLADYLNGRVNSTEEIRRQIIEFLEPESNSYEDFLNIGRLEHGLPLIERQNQSIKNKTQSIIDTDYHLLKDAYEKKLIEQSDLQKEIIFYQRKFIQLMKAHINHLEKILDEKIPDLKFSKLGPMLDMIFDQLITNVKTGKAAKSDDWPTIDTNSNDKTT